MTTARGNQRGRLKGCQTESRRFDRPGGPHKGGQLGEQRMGGVQAEGKCESCLLGVGGVPIKPAPHFFMSTNPKRDYVLSAIV